MGGCRTSYDYYCLGNMQLIHMHQITFMVWKDQCASVDKRIHHTACRQTEQTEQTDRQTDRTDRHIHRQTYIQTDIYTDRQNRQTYRQTEQISTHIVALFVPEIWGEAGTDIHSQCSLLPSQSCQISPHSVLPSQSRHVSHMNCDTTITKVTVSKNP